MWATILQVETPSCAWCRHASTKHPEVGLQVLTYYAREGGHAMETVRITGETWPKVVDEIRQIKSVDEVEVIESSAKEARVRVGALHCALPAAIEASGIVPQLPFDIAGGCDKWLLLTEQEKAKAFYDKLHEQGVDVKITYSGEYAPSPTLTPRQQEVLAAAMRHGYYDYPRRISLTDLAEKLGVAKSTLSQSLGMIESEVMRTANPLAVRAK